MDDNSLKQEIRKLREKLNMSQTELADALGISRTAYRNLEVGNTGLINKRYYQIMEILQEKAEEVTGKVVVTPPLQQLNEEEPQYKNNIKQKMEKEQMEKELLYQELHHLRSENDNLKRVSDAQEDLIQTMKEIIRMLRKIDSDKDIH